MNQQDNGLRHPLSGTARYEFPQERDTVPAEIDELVQFGLLKDISWHNDVAPSFRLVGYLTPDFAAKFKPSLFRLWVNCEKPADRELPMARFELVRMSPADLPDNAANYEPLPDDELAAKPVFSSESVAETVEFLTTVFFNEYLVEQSCCPWDDCLNDDIEDRNDAGYHDSMRPEFGVKREEQQCSGCGREWTVVTAGKDSRVVIDEGMPQSFTWSESN